MTEIELVLAPTPTDPAARYGAVPRPPDARLKAVLKETLRRHGFRLVRMRDVGTRAAHADMERGG